MSKLAIGVLTLLCAASTATAQQDNPPTQVELRAITGRGRELAHYDVAAWHATDAVEATNPSKGSYNRYIAKKNDDGTWLVVFGSLNETRDKFLIAYEARQGAKPTEFVAKKNDPLREDTGFFLSAGRGIDSALADFAGRPRRYNVAVLPAGSGQCYVYLMPAQTQEGVFPLGGDARYLVSPDGSKIVEKRQLHKAILDFVAPKPGETVLLHVHTTVLDDIPEDTDVFHVLARQPAVPEMVTTNRFIFRIETDGTINYLMTKEEFRKLQAKKVNRD